MDLLARRLLLTVAPAAIVVVLVYVTVFGDNGLMRRHRMEVDLERAQRKLTSIQEENAHLEREVRQLRGDEATLRRATAEELLLVPPGSVVYRFEP